MSARSLAILDPVAVRKARLDRNLTREVVAEKVGITERHLTRIENGDVDRVLEATAFKLSKALGRPVSDLFGVIDHAA